MFVLYNTELATDSIKPITHTLWRGWLGVPAPQDGPVQGCSELHQQPVHGAQQLLSTLKCVVET